MRPLTDEITRIRGLASPEDRATAAQALITAIAEAEVAVRDLRRRAVVELRAADPPWSHQRVAHLLGLHRNRAQQIWRGLSGGHTRRPDHH